MLQEHIFIEIRYTVMEGISNEVKRVRKRERSQRPEALSQVVTEEERKLEQEHIAAATAEKETQRLAKNKFVNVEPFKRDPFGERIVLQYQDVADVSTAPLHVNLPQVSNFGRNRKMLKNQDVLVGLKIKKGRFDLQEDSIIRRNYERAKALCHLDNDLLLLGYSWAASKELISYYKQMKKVNKFSLRLSNDLPQRTVASVFGRAKYLLSPLEKMSNFSRERKNRIKDLHKYHGNQWKEIGMKLNCCPESVRHFVENIVGSRKRHWTEEEKQALFNSLIKHGALKIPHTSKSKPNAWKEISKELRSQQIGRKPVQCQTHWGKVLSWKLSNPLSNSETAWTNLQSGQLIFILYHQPWKTEDDIDWDTMKVVFSKVAYYAVIRMQWTALKSQVLHHDVQPYRLVLSSLWENIYPKLVDNEQKRQLVESFYQDNKDWF